MSRATPLVLTIVLLAGGVATAQPAAGTSPVISDEVKELTWVGFQRLKDGSRVFVRTNEPARFKTTWQGQTKLLVEIFNTKVLVRNYLRPLDTQFFDSPVLLIKPSVIEAVSPTTRLVITLRQRVPITVKQEDNLIYIVFRQ